MTFDAEHDDRLRERLEKLLLGAVQYHTIDEIKAALEKRHGVRVAKAEVIAQLGKLKRAGFALHKLQRGPEPYYKLGPRSSEQLPLIGAKEYPD
jgi:ribosomal protein L23